MSSESGTPGKLLWASIVVAMGWAIGMFFLLGTYWVGFWLAPHIGWQGNREILGLLAAITTVWTFEHRHFEAKLDKLHER